jgi:hypothetical protein
MFVSQSSSLIIINNCLETKDCRLVFFGTMLEAFDMNDKVQLSKLKIFKQKVKTGHIEKVL